MAITLLKGRVKLNTHAKVINPSQEAVWLAASIPATEGQHVLEAGIGSGAGALCLHTRIPGLTVDGVELNEEALTLLKENAAQNEANITGYHQNILEFAPNNLYDHTFANPPFYRRDKGHNSPVAHRHLARSISQEDTVNWAEKLISLTKPNGTCTLIHHAINAQILMDIAPCETNVLFLKTAEHREPKRVIVQYHVGKPHKITQHVLPAYGDDIRKAILEDMQALNLNP